jgi:hypothetical protein
MSSLGTMARLFLIALVLLGVLTSWWWIPRAATWRRERAADRARRRAALRPGPPEPEPGSLEAVLRDFQEAADTGRHEIEVVVPAGVTIDRRTAAGSVVDVVLRDAIARSGYQVCDDTAATALATADGERRLVCRKLRTGPD